MQSQTDEKVAPADFQQDDDGMVQKSHLKASRMMVRMIEQPSWIQRFFSFLDPSANHPNSKMCSRMIDD